MKASEQFKSMEEVRQLAEQLRASVGEENFEYIEYALGILENQGIWQEVELNGEIIKLDRSMVDFIKGLNSRVILLLLVVRVCFQNTQMKSLSLRVGI